MNPVSQPSQSYQTHKRFDPLYHYVLTLLTAGVLALTLIQLIQAIRSDAPLRQPVISFLLALIAVIIFIRLRGYATKVQDRAIAAEEQLRYYVLSGKRFDDKLTIKQILALRFASDEEYLPLAERAAKEQLTPDQIKQAITSWRPDHYRV
ncbi:DUF6526 family protein [Paenibacillus solisilvae]|uniref:DUF6526 family protein n=1 Tax=Paenibacillus solisilvae TaxID=2486751 RepID=A0ABW0W2S1_9BACL